MAVPVFEAEALDYSVQGRFPALRGVDLVVRENEKVALLGANGSGKSSLLHLLDALVFAQGGEVRFLGRRLDERAMADEAFNAFFRKSVGLLFQDPDVQLFSQTVREEIAFGPAQAGLPGGEVEERVADLLRAMGLASIGERAPYELSGGEKKKVAIASVLALDPAVLLLDEPTGGLDPRTRAWVIGLIEELHRKGRTIVTATHDLDMARRTADRVIVLGEDHRIAAEGPAASILADRRLLQRVNLIHEHPHSHDGYTHSHEHGHYADHEHDHDDEGG
ncbi:MAG TPA: ATP-binding cassette domain-containing protein [Deltaproteobacteria bacterium]|nr:ATP-binding cassette domain-containing protein [Deltaproteobacteria bacterium]